MVQILLLEQEFNSIFGSLLDVLAKRGKSSLRAPMLAAWLKSASRPPLRKSHAN